MRKENISLYHFFSFSDYYGWQHLGMVDGYDSIKETKKDQEFNIKDSTKWKIMKLELVEEGDGE